MTVKEIMERVAINRSGRAIAYIKDALDEIAMYSPTHTKTIRIDIVNGQRFYNLPNEAINILDIRAKDHDNNQSLYKSIPRMIYEPDTKDTDGI